MEWRQKPLIYIGKEPCLNPTLRFFKTTSVFGCIEFPCNLRVRSCSLKCLQLSYHTILQFFICDSCAKSMASSRITELASIIASNTAKVNDYLSSRGLPTPSFEPGVPPSFLQEKPIFAPCQAILEATKELNALMLGPVGILAVAEVRLTLRYPSHPPDML